MSAGNLYRYLSLQGGDRRGPVRLDQAERARAFADLLAINGDIVGAMCAGLREHVFGKPPREGAS